MRIADFVPRMRPGERLYISDDAKVDTDEESRWIGPLSDAQMFAYWNHIIGPMNDRGGNIYCIIYSPVGGDIDETQQTNAEPEGA